VHDLGKKRGGRASRQKGNRTERALARYLQERGFAAERVPLSGAARGRFGGDVSVPLLGIDRRCEVKARDCCKADKGSLDETGTGKQF